MMKEGEGRRGNRDGAGGLKEDLESTRKRVQQHCRRVEDMRPVGKSWKRWHLDNGEN